jgi:hypothetical protein
MDISDGLVNENVCSGGGLPTHSSVRVVGMPCGWMTALPAWTILHGIRRRPCGFGVLTVLKMAKSS